MYFEQPRPITYIPYRLVDDEPVETKRIEAPAFAECDLYAAAPLERSLLRSVYTSATTLKPWRFALQGRRVSAMVIG